METLTQEKDTQSKSDESRARAAVISQPGEGVPVRAFGNEIVFQLTSEQSGGALTVGMATVPPAAVFHRTSSRERKSCS